MNSSNMISKPNHCQRRYPRYLISGEVRLFHGRWQGTAQLVQFGFGGMLLRGGSVIPKGSRALARIKPDKYPYEFELPIEVVEIRNALMAVRFVASSPSLIDFDRWLRRANYPTAPKLNPSQTLSQAKGIRCSTSIPRWYQSKDREAALEFMLQK
jgi:PilZ domain